MLGLSTDCQAVVEEVFAVLDEERVPKLEILLHGIELMTQDGRLKERNGLERNKVFEWTTRDYKGTPPAADDFRTLVGQNATKSSETAAGKRIIAFFGAVVKNALWYFDNPPDFDGIISREVMDDLAKGGFISRKRKRVGAVLLKK